VGVSALRPESYQERTDASSRLFVDLRGTMSDNSCPMTTKHTRAAGEEHAWEFKARVRARLRLEVAAGDHAHQGGGRGDQEGRQEGARRRRGGAVVFFERVSPAIEHVDGSSGSLGAAVNHALADE
jgi:hypothetical protein